ncbi:MAG: GNAT family N-acetyltransferase [Candidatus Omnitrophota bacterium]
MSDGDDWIIRPYAPKDRDAVRAIAWETAFAGNPAEAFFDDKELLCDALVSSFTDGDPGACWVAERRGEVCCYLLGTFDSRRLRGFFIRKVLPGILGEVFTGSAFASAKSRVFLRGLLTSWIKGELWMPDVSVRFPAVLHVNCKPPCRGLGAGSRLIRAFLGSLSEKGVPGVRLATVSDGAREFFEKLGFSVLHKGQRSYWQFFLGKKVPAYLMVRQIS